MSQWEKALESLEELSKIDPDNKYLISTSHYYCQLTQKHIDQHDIGTAETFFKKSKNIIILIQLDNYIYLQKLLCINQINLMH